VDEDSAALRAEQAPHAGRRGGERISRAGNPELSSDFATFYRQQTPGLVAFVMWLGAPVHDAENIAQETMLRAYKGRKAIEHPRTWIRVVASREYFRSVLNGNDDPVAEVPETSRPGIDAAVTGEEQARVLALLRRLPPRQRQIMAWVYDGYKPKEIAVLLGIELNAVRVSLHKARETVKAYLEQKGGGF
jgi:RNA polymerase sigma factor (sigma-70 family)